MSHDAILIIFAKAPVLGEVNTRLAPHIGSEAARALQQELIELRMQQFADSDTCDVELYCSPDTSHETFQHCRNEYGVKLSQQTGRDLGERMSHAMRDALQDYSRVVLVGTDAPAVDNDTIRDALQQLDDHKVVLQPAEDGGYVMIAMREFNAAVFQTVPWGTERVLIKTRSNLVAAGMSWSELETSWDIDTPEDLLRYRDIS